MGSEKTQELPIIDFTKENLTPNTSHWISTRNKVQQAFVDYGCFVAKYDEVSLKMHNHMLGEVKGVFDSISEDINVQNTFEDPWYYFRRPYLPLLNKETLLPLSNREAFLSLSKIEAFNICEGVTNLNDFIKTVWPNGNDAFCVTFLSYAKMLAKLDQTVAKMVFESYGVEKNFESHHESMTYSMLVFKYGATQEPTLGFRSHSDKSFNTILDTNHVKGLEILTKDEKQWLGYDPVPGQVILMAGDAFFGWSNGRIHSPTHRVLYGGNEDRYTIKLTSYARDLVKVPKELVDDEHPLLFKPFSNSEYHTFSMGKSGDRHDLKIYCGI